jgi:predicted MFS family arabinose efflux permease
MPTSPSPSEKSLHGSLGILAVTAGISISNIYYNQPLLAAIGKSFPHQASWIGAVPAATQLGFAIGMVLLSPLGDRMDRRRLIIGQAMGACGALLMLSIAPALLVLIAASFMLGFFSTMAQQAGPFAAELAPASERGRAIGFVMSGLLLGILMARVFAGFIGEYLGWRMVFGAAMIAILGMVALVFRYLPPSKPTSSLTYGELMASPWQLARELPGLREAALTGASLFAAFSLFWTTLILLLSEAPFFLGSQEAGLFALVGVAGVMAAPWAGKLADRYGPRRVIWLAIFLMAFSFVILWVGETHIVILLAGVVVLDAGLQVMQTPNQSRIFALRPEAKSRLNTVYMVCYFFGGAMGSLTGYWAWQWLRWPGVCLAGIAFTLIAAASHCRCRR